MGIYIEVPDDKHKANQLVDLIGARRLPGPVDLVDVPPGEALVCVVDNGAFEAAGVMYDAAEVVVFTDRDDLRPKEWLLVPVDRALALVNPFDRKELGKALGVPVA